MSNRIQLGDRVKITSESAARMRSESPLNGLVQYVEGMVGQEGEVVGTFLPFTMIRVRFNVMSILLEAAWVEPVVRRTPIELPN